MSDLPPVPRLPFDVSRCMHDEDTCPLAENCLRYLAPRRKGYQSFSAFTAGEDCSDYIPWVVDTPKP